MADPYRNNVMERKAAKRRGFGTGFKAAADSRLDRHWVKFLCLVRCFKQVLV